LERNSFHTLLNLFRPKVEIKIIHALLLYEYALLKGKYKKVDTSSYPPLFVLFKNDDNIDFYDAKLGWRLIDTETNQVMSSQLPEKNKIDIPAYGILEYFTIPSRTLPRTKEYKIKMELCDKYDRKISLEKEVITNKRRAYEIYRNILNGS
jgi:hypothetical protein